MQRVAVIEPGGLWMMLGTESGLAEISLETGGKTLLGKTANYQERMQNEISQIANSYWSK